MNRISIGLDSRGKDLPRSSANQFSWIRVRNSAVLILLLIGILLPRGLALDRLVTPDEIRWLTRSGNFYHALAQREFANTYQWSHPGVTVMWAGMIAFLYHYPAYSVQVAGQINWWLEEVGTFLSSHGYDPLDLLVASRLNMIYGITLALIAAFWAAIRLLGFWPAVIGFLLIAVDPFHIALSRLLHLDGMSSSLMLLAVLAFLNYLYRGGRRRDLALSGAAAGLAWLTKSPALFLIPFVGLFMLAGLVGKRRSQNQLLWKDLWQASSRFILWGAIGLAVFVLLWPAMWVDPYNTLRSVLLGMTGYAIQGHESPLYFNGVIYTGDPGAHFYPITYLWRTTPVVLLGLGLAALALLAPRSRLIQPALRRPLLALLLFAVLFTLFMNLGAKKFDRYLLPIYPPLDLIAGVGWVAAAGWIGQRRSWRLGQVIAPGMLLLAVIGQAAGAVSSYPYYLSYYNPLLGGTVRAPEVMMVGWGEGLDQAAHFLNSRPGAEPPQVMLGFWSGTFSYFFNGPIRWSSFSPDETTLRDWLNSDYCIIYINQWQRERLPLELVDYLSKRDPALIVRLQGLDYAYVYDLSNIPPPDYLLAGLDGVVETDIPTR